VVQVKIARRLLLWSSENAGRLVELAAFLALAVGCWWVWEPLGLIVPAALVLGLSIVSRWRGTL
jgi:hypothetical protein